MEENMDIQVTYINEVKNHFNFKTGRPRLTDEERIKQKSEGNKVFKANFVSIGCEYERWQAIKAERNLKTHRAVAAFLINYYRHGEAIKQSSIPTSAGSCYAHARPSSTVSLQNQLKKKTDDCIVMKQEYVDETFIMSTSNGNNNTCNSTGNSVNNPQKQVTGQNCVNNPQKQVTGQNCVNNPQKQVTGQNCMNNPQNQVTGQSSVNTGILDNQDEVKKELNSDDTLVDQLHSDNTQVYQFNSVDTSVDHTNNKTSNKTANTQSTTINKESTTATNNPSSSASYKTTTHNDDSAKNADNDQINVFNGDDSDKDSKDELEKLKRKMVEDNGDKVFQVVEENHSDVKFSAKRPNYAALAWTKNSESDKSASDNDGDDEKNDDDVYIVSHKDHVDNDEEEDIEHSDEDYLPSNEVFEVKTDEDGICLGDSTESIKRKEAAKKSAVYEANKKTKALTKKLQDKKNWKSIKLEDHQDKFCVVDIQSFERQHRGNSCVIEKGYKCLVCQRFKCSDKKTIHYHLEEHENMVLECLKCDFIAALPKELQIHQNQEGHFESASYVCEICGLVFKSNTNRNDHRGKIHDIPVYKCSLCPEKFARHYLKHEHMRDAHPDLCEFCVICRRSLLKSNFEKHAKFCKTNEVCELCGKVMPKKQLHQHMVRLHSGIRRHQCTLCDYSAKFSSSLRRHMLTHNKLHPFQCDQCTFSCNQMSQLRSHMRTHSGEKPFKCTQCNYAASWNVQLKDHVKIHGMPETVTCNQCGILFKNKRSLDLHRKKEHS